MGRVDEWHQNLFMYGMVPYMITLVWFIHRVGDRDKLLDWEYIKALFRAVSPFFWASLGMYVSISMSVLGAAWCALRIVATRLLLSSATMKRDEGHCVADRNDLAHHVRDKVCL
jgi:hypothetical protein